MIKLKVFGAVAALAIFVGVGVAGADAYTFTRNLTVGSTGPDVVALQEMLIASNDLVMPAGVAKGYFGPLTRTALAAWQAKNAITPAVGYFGPITMAKVAAMGGTTGGTTGGDTSDLAGGEGDFGDFDVLGNPDNEDVEEGETVEVLGFEFDADDSDLLVERVSVVVEAQSGSTTKPWKVLDEVVLMADGEEVASVDASEADAWDEEATDQYSININNVDYKVEDGDTAKIYVAVTANDSIDSEDLGEWTIELDNDGVRAVDAEGINIYEGGDGEIDADADERDFTLTVVDAGTVDLAFDEDDAGNDDEDVDIDNNNETKDVVLYTFTIESEDGDITLDEISVDVSTTSGTVARLDDIVTELVLEIDGDEISSETVSGVATDTVYFEDLGDISVDEDEEVEVVVKATVDASDDIANFSEGDGVKVTGVTVNYVDSEDDDQTADELDGTEGGDITLRESGMTIDLSGNPSAVESFTADADGEGDVGTYTIKFEVSAGDDDVYVGDVAYSYTTIAGGATSSSFSGPTSKLQSNNINYKVGAGSSAVFTMTVEIEAASTTSNTAVRVALDTIYWNTTNSTTTYEEYTSGLDDFETSDLFLRGIN